MRVPVALLAALCASAPGSQSAIREWDGYVSMLSDTMLFELSVTGLAGDDGRFLRNRFDFDPSWQSIELVAAGYGFPGSVARQVPDWAVDTLSGAGGYPRSLVFACPGLMPGMELSYEVRVRDWSPLYSLGPWTVFRPSQYPPIGRFSLGCDDPRESLSWEGEGYSHRRTPGGGHLFEATAPASDLWISSTGSWDVLADFILAAADSIASSPGPPDLRGAVIEYSAGGADPFMAAARARGLLTGSFAVSEPGHGWNALAVDDLQSLLDSRTATPLEMAVLLKAICLELGLTAEITAVTGSRPALPVPWGWDRFLVRIGDGSGRSVTVEPSARLVQSGYVHAPDTLFLVRRSGGGLLVFPPNSPMENMCRERWTLDPSGGTFGLELDCRGYYDMVLRRITAGLQPGELPGTLSAWMWRSGSLLVPDSVWISDPYDLSTPAVLRASGGLPGPEQGGFFIRSPRLSWDEPGGMARDILRSWASGSPIRFPVDAGPVLTDSVPEFVLTDSGGTCGTFLMMVGGGGR